MPEYSLKVRKKHLRKKIEKELRERELTGMQKKFCDAYLLSPDPKEAAKIAGYSADDPNYLHYIASKNLSLPNLQYYMSKFRKHEEEHIVEERQKIISILHSLIDYSKESKQIEDKETGEIKRVPDVKEMMLIINELNKMRGNHAPSKVINTNLNIDVDLEILQKLAEEYRRDF